MESVEVRREYLRQGGSLAATARALGTTRQNVEWHVKRANRIAPLRFGQGAPEDCSAVAAYQRAALTRVGIATPPG